MNSLKIPNELSNGENIMVLSKKKKNSILS